MYASNTQLALLNEINTKYIIKQKISKNNFERILNSIKMEVDCNICPFYDPIGSKAALSITAPLTQLVLNSIHGIKMDENLNKIERTSPTSRFSELLDNAKNIKNPIYIVSHKDPYNKENAEKLLNSIEEINLNKFLSESYINTNYKTDFTEKRILEIDICTPFTIDIERFNELASPSYIVMKFDIIKMLHKNISLDKIKTDILNDLNFSVKNIIGFRNSSNYTNNRYIEIYFKQDTTLDDIKNMFHYITNYYLISGIYGCRNAIIHKFEGISEYNEKLDKLVEKPEYKIIFNANPYSFMKLIDIPGIDINRILTNDVNESLELFGIESARTTLFEELIQEASKSKELESITTKIFKLVSDYLTHRGVLSSISRYGCFKNKELDDIHRVSFEQGASFLIDSAGVGNTNIVDGVFSTCFYGQLLQVGTGKAKTKYLVELNDIKFDKIKELL